MICMYKALEYLQPLRNRVKYSYYLPNKFNFSFDLYYFIILAMLAYAITLSLPFSSVCVKIAPSPPSLTSLPVAASTISE